MHRHLSTHPSIFPRDHLDVTILHPARLHIGHLNVQSVSYSCCQSQSYSRVLECQVVGQLRLCMYTEVSALTASPVMLRVGFCWKARGSKSHRNMMLHLLLQKYGHVQVFDDCFCMFKRIQTNVKHAGGTIREANIWKTGVRYQFS